MKNRIFYFLCLVTAFTIGIDFCLLSTASLSNRTANLKFELLTTDNYGTTRSQVYRASDQTTVSYYEDTFPAELLHSDFDFGPIPFAPTMATKIKDLEGSGGRVLERTSLKNTTGEEVGERVLMECSRRNGTFTKIMRTESYSFRTIDSESRESALAFEKLFVSERMSNKP